MSENRVGKVYLVGAGPGDPGLLTLKAKACIEQADVIVFDHLANRAFLGYGREDVEFVYVGKKGGSHTRTQDEINRLIVDKARQGLAVIRLKGGDPFVFGRGGEEAQELARAGIPFEVVPGVTSAVAVPAYAGIPLTHRDYTSTVAFITGHEDPTKEQSDIAWDKLATGAGTLVFLMGVGNLPAIAQNLIVNGRSPDTPVAVIHRGSVPGQKTVEGSLKDIAEKVREQGLGPPAVILVGEVAALRRELNWFESRPLFGRRIVVTRAREQSSDFLARLSDLGAECIEFPTIEVIPPESWQDLDKTIDSLDSYQWLLFTSVNGVRYFFERLEAQGKDVRDLKGIKIGAIGPKTADAVRERGIRPDLVPEEYRAEAVVEAFRKKEPAALRILLPRAARAREVLPRELEKMSARVDVVDAYRTVRPNTDTGRVREMLERGEIHMVTFTSSSTVRNFLEMFEEEDREAFLGWMGGVAVACIGPVTAETAEKEGLQVRLVPSEYTVEALTEAIVGYFKT
ncbi:MAG: uroporphyrinogen-III C-methyltransferase [Deltaproteobacteria bacterium]|nr:uroporphyrinogen-III C-methyltransferase [Deltaproteobacteria bacterium]